MHTLIHVLVHIDAQIHRYKDTDLQEFLAVAETRIRQLEDSLQQREMQLIRGNAVSNNKAGVISQVIHVPWSRSSYKGRVCVCVCVWVGGLLDVH